MSDMDLMSETAKGLWLRPYQEKLWLGNVMLASALEWV
jgi:hypothetical protein